MISSIIQFMQPLIDAIKQRIFKINFFFRKCTLLHHFHTYSSCDELVNIIPSTGNSEHLFQLILDVEFPYDDSFETSSSSFITYRSKNLCKYFHISLKVILCIGRKGFLIYFPPSIYT